jgi:hypothetical protein
MAAVLQSVPEQGQLVRVRSRQWVVNEVKPSTLSPPAMKPSFDGAQNLITLASVEDDGLGEELQVVWEVEPGASVIEKVALPEPTDFDPPEKLDAFLDARQMCLGRNTCLSYNIFPARRGGRRPIGSMNPEQSASRRHSFHRISGSPIQRLRRTGAPARPH